MIKLLAVFLFIFCTIVFFYRVLWVVIADTVHRRRVVRTILYYGSAIVASTVIMVGIAFLL